MAAAYSVSGKDLSAAISSLSVTQQIEKQPKKTFINRHVQIKKTGENARCFFLSDDMGENAYKLLHAFSSVYDVSSEQDLSFLAKEQEMQSCRATLPDGSRKRVLISSEHQGKFSTLAFCSLRPEKNHASDSAIAIKIPHYEDVDPGDPMRTQALNVLEAEILRLKELNHPNIIPLLGCLTRSEMFPLSLMITPRQQGTIKDLLLRSVDLKPFRMAFCHGLMAGVSYIHQKKFCHRDLKPANVLVGYDGELRICDLGASREINQNGCYFSRSSAGTRTCWAPEVQTFDQDGHRIFGVKADTFAAGVIMAKIMRFHSMSPGRGRVGPVNWLTSSQYINEQGEKFSRILPKALVNAGIDEKTLLEGDSDCRSLGLTSPEALCDHCEEERMALIIVTCLRDDFQKRSSSKTVHDDMLTLCPPNSISES